ncbi:hypothetical protein [Candidatus Nitrospira allomarina]|uniref:Uncharacterized protein n=1 Tax=Candidatus Nitrospira allomarina TaxID=3020900 RepID=A0AA96JXQ1_9BACT|nr:hypothetical protein [Candidatus Nitrospira allomarina]WNM59281.1 hypothetical protein PP769_05810 [Candidatus Nitrospira allomarina]
MSGDPVWRISHATNTNVSTADLDADLYLGPADVGGIYLFGSRHSPSQKQHQCRTGPIGLQIEIIGKVGEGPVPPDGETQL